MVTWLECGICGEDLGEEGFSGECARWVEGAYGARKRGVEEEGSGDWVVGDEGSVL